MQVILEDSEYRDIQRVARANHMTLAEWVRRALTIARRREPSIDASKKLAAVRAATRHAFPSGEMRQILAEIERGYGSDHRP